MITIELIDEFRKRTNSSYSDAKFYLEKNNGDILEAIIDFERTKTGKTHKRAKPRHDPGMSFADILQKAFDTRIVVEDNKTAVFSVPIVILILLLVPFGIFVLLAFLFLMLLGYKISIREVKKGEVNVNDVFNNISQKMKEARNKYAQQRSTHNYSYSRNEENPRVAKDGFAGSCSYEANKDTDKAYNHDDPSSTNKTSDCSDSSGSGDGIKPDDTLPRQIEGKKADDKADHKKNQGYKEYTVE
jgi:hypothetical protein